MNSISIDEVFRPSAMPSYTYINRSPMPNGMTYEARLERALRQTGNLVSITGGSKTGKTVLFRKVVSKDRLVEISGSQIKKPADFWNLIAEKLNIPDEVSVVYTSQNTSGGKIGTSGKLTLAGILGFGLSAENNISDSEGKNITQKVTRNNTIIIKILIDNGYVLVIDDFHYIDPETQLYLARTIKAELFDGLKVILLSLPHRTDDIIKRNPDLIGRIVFIDLHPWSQMELRQIASKGFELLGIGLSEEMLSYIAEESATSPQLMQENCSNLAYLVEYNSLVAISHDDIKAAFAETAYHYPNYADVVNNVLKGPSKGKSRRKEYTFADGRTGDIYRLLLLSICEDPPTLKLTIDEIKERLAKFIGQSQLPPTPNLSKNIGHAEAIIKESVLEPDTIDWKEGTLYILDPFLLFYLRWEDSWKHT